MVTGSLPIEKIILTTENLILKPTKSCYVKFYYIKGMYVYLFGGMVKPNMM